MSGPIGIQHEDQAYTLLSAVHAAYHRQNLKSSTSTLVLGERLVIRICIQNAGLCFSQELEHHHASSGGLKPFWGDSCVVKSNELAAAFLISVKTSFDGRGQVVEAKINHHGPIGACFVLVSNDKFYRL